jgi:ferredoxin
VQALSPVYVEVDASSCISSFSCFGHCAVVPAGEKWKSMSAEEKAPYEAQAKEVSGG